jgi:adenylate cyclase
VIGRQSPAVILFEDVHWLDEASELVFDALVEGFVGSKVLLLINFRPGFHRDWMNEGRYSQIDLVPLTGDATARIVLDSIGSHPTTTDLQTKIVDRAHGNPFFAEEIVRALVDRKVLIGEHGKYTTTQANPAGALPNTIRGVISFRLDRLEEAQKRYLEAACVIGREFPAGIAAEVGGMDQTTTEPQIQGLLSMEMVYRVSQAGSDNLAFKHPLVQEVAYASLVSERRKSLHRRAAKALSAYFAKSLPEHAALIARHWEEGGEPIQAASHYMMSATWIGTREPRQAVQTWEHVRKLTSSLPSDESSKFMRLMACGQIINLSWRESATWREKAAPELLETFYKEGRMLARELKDVRAAALITMAYGRALLASGSVDDYLAGVKEAQEMLSERPNPSVAALLKAVESHATGQAGFLQRALDLNTVALENIHRIDAIDQRTLGFNAKHWLTALRARYLMQTGDHSGWEHLITELLDHTDGLDLTHRVIALGIRVDAAALDGNPSRASKAVNELDGISGQSTSPYISVLSNYFRGISLLAAKEYIKARASLTKATEVAHQFRAGLELEPLILANLAEAGENDEMSKSLDLAKRAEALAKHRSQRVAQLFAVSSQIRIRARAGVRDDPAVRREFERLIAITGAERLRLRVTMLL